MATAVDTVSKAHFSAGAILFREGEPGERAYLIDKGRVALTLLREGEAVHLGSLGPGELVGEMALIDDGHRTATVTAISDLEVTVLSKSLVEKFLRDSNPSLRLFLRVIIDRFRRLQDNYSPQRGWVSHDIQSGQQIEEVRKQAMGELELVRELSEALEKNEFELVFQPVFSLADGMAAGFEALIRWNHPGRGLIQPHDFIALAEKSGLIVPIGYWILREAFIAHTRFQASARSSGTREQGPIFTCINLSMRQLEDESLVETIEALVQETGVDTSTIKLEITETFLMSDPQAARHILLMLRALGFSIAIDDFGTGFSSLSSLHSFPIHTIKIDQSFVRIMNENPVVKKVIMAIIWLARELKLDIVAEGIEEEVDIKTLQDMGCNYGQGFFVSKPLPFARATEFLARHKGW